MENQMLEIGKRIIGLREERGLSRAELARRCGLSTQTLYCTENGRNTTIDNLLKIATALNADLIYLITGKQDYKNSLVLGRDVSWLDDFQRMGLAMTVDTYLDICQLEKKKQN